jgi:hypothetical protein
MRYEDDDDDEYDDDGPPPQSAFEQGFSGAMGGCLGVIVFLAIAISLLVTAFEIFG